MAERGEEGERDKKWKGKKEEEKDIIDVERERRKGSILISEPIPA